MRRYISVSDIRYMFLAILIILAAGSIDKWLEAKEQERIHTDFDTSICVIYTDNSLDLAEPKFVPETYMFQPLESFFSPQTPDYILDSVPLSEELQTILYNACKDAGIDYSVGLGLIEVESGFKSDAVSSCGAYGFCQLNPRYFPAGLSDEDNIKAGIGYLGELLEKYGDLDAALTSYNRGFDNGNRFYANKVLASAGKYKEEKNGAFD